ncbi:PepSY-associated TM helix domain-containing protein [uncultured Xylophilus sp.]|uniref:PepSY-associated TM helix domain-containing protein n=1 Tax=uncultured Xylophilus sp. TaxID=296832 RepID=UPI0034571825
MPQGRLAWVEAPGHPRGAFMVRVQQPGDPSFRFPHSYVYIDRYSGKVLAVQDRQKFGASNAINNWLHPLHDGSAGGLLLRVLLCIAGFLPAALWITGLWRWRLRTAVAAQQNAAA